MRRALTTHTIGLTILMTVFVFQLAHNPLSDFAVGIIGSIHKSSFNQFFIIFTKFISYAVLLTCLGLFLLQILYVSPHAVENASSITFLCLTIYLNSTLKLLFAEFRPYMWAVLRKLEVQMYDCETDFGMPSGHVFLGVCFYYLLRMAIFEELEKLESPRQVIDESRKSFVGHLIKFKDAKQKLGQAKFRFHVFEIKMHWFNFILLTYIILLAISRVLAASHYLSQVLFGFLTGFSWGWIFFTYLRQPLRGLVHEILAVPNSRPKTRRLINLTVLIMSLITTALYVIRQLLRNETERNLLVDFLKINCNSHMILENKNLQDSMLILLPVFMLNFYVIFPPRKFISTTTEARPLFWSLNRENKLLRFVVLVLPMLFILIIKITIDKTIKQYYDHATVYDFINMAFFLLMFAFLYSVVLPFIFNKLGILLRDEFIENGGASGPPQYLMQDEEEDDNPMFRNSGGRLEEFLRTNSNIGERNSRNSHQLADQLDGRDIRESNLQEMLVNPPDHQEDSRPNDELEESIE
jgi:membrane-associated phospholipid phosphatase